MRDRERRSQQHAKGATYLELELEQGLVLEGLGGAFRNAHTEALGPVALVAPLARDLCTAKERNTTGQARGAGNPTTAVSTHTTTIHSTLTFDLRERIEYAHVARVLLREARSFQGRDDGLDGGWEWKRKRRSGCRQCENSAISLNLLAPPVPAGRPRARTRRSRRPPRRVGSPVSRCTPLRRGRGPRRARRAPPRCGAGFGRGRRRPHHNLGQADHVFRPLVPRVSGQLRIRRHGVLGGRGGGTFVRARRGEDVRASSYHVFIFQENERRRVTV